MSVVGYDPGVHVCVNHRRRETRLRCGKCGDYICTRCTVQTPVGVRCRGCARLRRLPQFDVDVAILLRAVPAGLAVSTLAWYLTSFLVYLRFFLSIGVGVAVGETVSRLALRRSSRVLEILTVFGVLVGLLLVELMRRQGDISSWWASLSSDPASGIALVLPAVIASYVAVVKLR